MHTLLILLGPSYFLQVSCPIDINLQSLVEIYNYQQLLMFLVKLGFPITCVLAAARLPRGPGCAPGGCPINDVTQKVKKHGCAQAQLYHLAVILKPYYTFMKGKSVN